AGVTCSASLGLASGCAGAATSPSSSLLTALRGGSVDYQEKYTDPSCSIARSRGSKLRSSEPGNRVRDVQLLKPRDLLDGQTHRHCRYRVLQVLRPGRPDDRGRHPGFL